MADLRGQELKDSYQNVVTRGTGNKLDNGNGVEFADLDDKASLSDVVLPVTASDILTLHEANDLSVSSRSYVNVFDLTGEHEIVSGGLYGSFLGARLTIDGDVVFNRTSNAVSRDSGGNAFSTFVIPKAKSATSMKLELYNISNSSRDYGWRVITR